MWVGLKHMSDFGELCFINKDLAQRLRDLLFKSSQISKLIFLKFFLQ